MKRFLMMLATLGWVVLALAVPQEWSVDVSRVRPCQFEAYHGETIDLKASFFFRGEPYPVAGEDFSLFWQTNGMGSAWWTAPASAVSNTVYTTFTAAMDPGEPLVYGFLGSTGSNYRASFAVRFAPSPGAVPNELPLPAPVIDFSKVSILNAPWVTEASLTNYVPTTRTVNNKALSADISLTASDVGALGNSGNQTLNGNLQVGNSAQENIHLLEDAATVVAECVKNNYSQYSHTIPNGTKNDILALLSDMYAAVQQIAPAWVSGTAYTQNALVTYDGVVYRCKANTVSPHTTTPNTDTTHWEAKKVSELFLPLSGGEVYSPTYDGTLDVRNDGPDRTVRIRVKVANGSYWLGISTVGFELVGNERYYHNLPTASGTLALTSDIPSVSGLAPLASPEFTGAPRAPTPTSGDDSTKVATTAFVKNAIDGISVTPLSGNTYDFSTMQGVFDALKAAIEALGGTVTNAPTSSQGE